MTDLPSQKISESGISNLFQYQLKEAGVAKYLNLENADRTYEVLKEFTERQYRFLNWLYIEKAYKKIAMLLIENGMPANQDYIDYKNSQD